MVIGVIKKYEGEREPSSMMLVQSFAKIHQLDIDLNLLVDDITTTTTRIKSRFPLKGKYTKTNFEARFCFTPYYPRIKEP